MELDDLSGVLIQMVPPLCMGNYLPIGASMVCCKRESLVGEMCLLPYHWNKLLFAICSQFNAGFSFCIDLVVASFEHSITKIY